MDLSWSGQYTVDPSQRPSTLPPGDKIILPPSALEGLLSAAATLSSLSTDDDDDAEDSGPSTSTFDPFNPYSFAAERSARAAQQQHRRQQRQQQLPHPLTFRLVNPVNGRVVYAGIREFSAEEEHIVLSSFLGHALGLEDSQVKDGQDSTGQNGPRITVHAKQLPKGTLVRLRPLEAGYDVEDWKSLLEQHLRTNFTTLTNGEVLTIPGGVGQRRRDTTEEYRFLIDKVEPAGDGICIVDTDLEVDIEPLNEEQARETLQRRLANATNARNGKPLLPSSSGGDLKNGEVEAGQVQDGQYVDYQITNWDRSKDLEIELDVANDEDEVDLFVSLLSAKQQARPREDEHVFGEFSSRYPKRIRLSPKDYAGDVVDAIWVSVHRYKPPEDGASKTGLARFSLQATSLPLSFSDTASTNDQSSQPLPPPHDNEVQCPNCEQYVPKPTLMLHENFCLRNNILCPRCRNIFKKRSPEWTAHWHCSLDEAHGNTTSSFHKHQHIFHTPLPCSACTSYTAPNIPALAHHRVTTCPSKLIICRFCHLLVPQGDASEESFLYASSTDLTPHEYTDGARTTDCHICNKIIRLRDLETHMRYHDLERKRRVRPVRCRNENCSRTLDTTGATLGTDTYGLCSLCYGPFYVSMYDPEGKALRRRVERRYLTQLMTGCKNGWCRNEFCRTGREHITGSPGLGAAGGETPTGGAMTAKEASAVAKPFVDAFTKSGRDRPPVHFCVDEQRQRRRTLAEMMAGLKKDGDGDAVMDDVVGVDGLGQRREREGKRRYALEWCLAALEACQGDVGRAWAWLVERAPTLEEEEGSGI